MRSQHLTPASGKRFASLLEFFRSGSAGGAVLIACAAAALVWSNSRAASGYFHLVEMTLGVTAAGARFVMPLHLWVNDGLMALFFLLVGLEIRREMVEGALASRQRVAAPGLAALGGMVVPALIYIVCNRADPAALKGWAVPVATDIAFSLAVLQALGRRVPAALKVFLTALAIIDDLGAIVVIAVFYTHGLDVAALGLAGLVLLGLYGLNRAGVGAPGPYMLGGLVLWALVFRSGVHATLAGVALAFVVPMHEQENGPASAARRLEHALGGWVNYAVLPLFGLANAGLSFASLPAGVASDPLVLGIVLGLVLGKQIGVFGATALGARLGIARLPGSLTTGQLYGGAVLCGIGFTMSLFIGDLAFRGAPREAKVKIAVFAASLASALLGLLVLAVATRARRAGEPAG